MSNQINLDTRGVLTVQDQAGQPVKIVIKLAGKGYGNGLIVGDRQYQICRYVPTIKDRKSPAQLAHRERFKAAVAAWQALPEAERQRLHEAAKAAGRTGWNRFIAGGLSTQDEEKTMTTGSDAS